MFPMLMMQEMEKHLHRMNNGDAPCVPYLFKGSTGNLFVLQVLQTGQGKTITKTSLTRPGFS